MAIGSVNVPGDLPHKQDKLTGLPGQVVGFDKNGKAVAQATSEAGVSSFNGRTGAVVPAAGDYTAAQVGAAAADHTHPVQTSVSGNAGTATKLATARTIKVDLTSDTAESFDGSANITPGVSGILGTANGGLGNNSGYVRKGQKSGTTVGSGATIEGHDNAAPGENGHAEGNMTTASGSHAHAEGWGTTAGPEAHAHAEGCSTTASGFGAHAEGMDTVANGKFSHAAGYGTVAEYYGQTVVGVCNVQKSPSVANLRGDLFVVGNGTISNDGNIAAVRSNMFRVSGDGIYGSGQYHSTGADYAELFEWKDGNPGKEDRVGRFVTLDGEKIRLATSEDDFILGIISGNPSVVGDVHDDQWQGMFMYDIFGRPIWEDVEVPARTVAEPDPENPENMITRIIVPAHTERRQKLNPDYDSGQKYIPRSERPEWGCVGMMGKLVVIDDGTCKINGWCKPSEGGVATSSEERTDFRIMARIDETHVRVLALGRR